MALSHRLSRQRVSVAQLADKIDRGQLSVHQLALGRGVDCTFMFPLRATRDHA